MSAERPRIEVREYATRKLIRVVELQSADPVRAEKVLSGLLRQLDTDRLYAVEKGLARPKAERPTRLRVRRAKKSC